MLEIRAYIKSRSLLGTRPVGNHREVCSIYGEGQMSHRTTYNRGVAKLRTGQRQLKDAYTGRPATTTSKGNIEKIRNMRKKDVRFTIRQLAGMTNSSLARVHGILKKHLKLRKINARWIPYLLTDEQKRTRVTMTKQSMNMYPKYSKKVFRQYCYW